jgi:hypothetical protein
LTNQLTVREEPPQFPQSISLQGRIVPPPVFRVDQADKLQAPHFTVQANSPLSEPEFMVSTSDWNPRHKIDELDSPHEGRPSMPHFLRRAAIPKTRPAAAVAARPISSLSQSDMKPSVTPVADALRQLQGGQQ